MKAVVFGAGNIGRGLIGSLLHQAGYELVFLDVSAPLVDAVNAAPAYTVHEIGEAGRNIEVTGFRAVDSRADPDAAVAEVATADLAATAVGPSVLRFVAPLLCAGLLRRDPALPPLPVMACENAINATDLLRGEVDALEEADPDVLASRAVFANTAVDRIVPEQPRTHGVDVTVEAYAEWTIERRPFGKRPPVIPLAHFVDDLAPYIERKLFTVNTGHATAAYFGARAGAATIADALADDLVAARVSAVLAETSALLVAKHGFAPAELAAYRSGILGRFRLRELTDSVLRVGRQPLRKLSRHERFVGPAAEAAERGLPTDALVAAIGAVLSFRAPGDPQAEVLAERLVALDADEFTTTVTGLDAAHPLYAPVRDTVNDHMATSRA
ncbi:mannitol-1-phosphate 5-dehydrogenase [Propionicicella superfundia]|uniref:mannitol-1-phosphate 5-dehydrogenase n=1 Tax=Propionicicella superfundia TaxID=348582 RepID=UPI000417CAF6|nr:mannitol-1-phosphate 5-dehydrogenase [Propionicicella superfundia]